MNNTAKNILQIFASSSWGGGEQYVYDLSQCLLQHENSVIAVSRKSNDIETRLKSLNIPLFVFPLKSCVDLFSILLICSLIRKSNIDIIHTHQFKDTFIAIFARMLSGRNVKIIFTRHLVKRAKTNFLYSFLYRKINKLIFVSQLAKTEFLSSNPLIKLNKITVIHNSILENTNNKHVTNIRTHYNIDRNTVILGFTGRIVPEKGLDVLIDALEKIKDKNFILFIVGKGKLSYEQSLKAKITTYGLNKKVVFMGFVSDIQQFVKQADVGVLPSIWREPFGLTIIEFMQAGKAVITTNNGAQKEFITHNENGILIAPSDVDALSTAIYQLITNKSLQEKLGKQAREYFSQHLSYPIFFNKIITVYHENSF